MLRNIKLSTLLQPCLLAAVLIALSSSSADAQQPAGDKPPPAAIAAPAGAPVEGSATEAAAKVTTLDGASFTAKDVKLHEGKVDLVREGKAQQLSSAQILQVDFPLPASRPAQPPTVAWVELVDGSQLKCAAFEVKGSAVQCRLVEGAELNFKTNALASARFEASAPNTSGYWNDVRTAEQTGDVFVVHKQDQLDHLSGTVGDVTAEAIGFELDGEKLSVKRPKVFGVVYFHATKPAAAAAAPVKVALAGGSSLMLQGISLDDKQLAGQLAGGAAAQVARRSVARVDLSAGKLLFLSDVEPESVSWTPYLGAAASPAETAFFRPRANRGLLSGPITLDGRTFERGLSLHSRTEIRYRLNDPFTRLTGIAGIDDRSRPLGKVHLTISSPDRTLFEADITSGPATPLSVDLAGAKRLTILVDFGGDGDAGDILDLADLKVTK